MKIVFLHLEDSQPCMMRIVSNGESITHNEESLSAIYKILSHERIVSHGEKRHP
jgi:hypothetical protein